MKQIDITPSIGIYADFKAHNYTIKSATAELIDNSTSSLIKNFKRLSLNQDYVPMINIILQDSESIKDRKFIVSDNAFGVEDFDRILKLKPPANPEGRNEYGRGLKTSGFWFGKKISVFTKQFDTKKAFELNFDLEKVDEHNTIINLIELNEDEWKTHSNFDFGTTIEFSKLYRSPRKSDWETWKNELAFNYSNDVKEKKLEIRLIRIFNNKIYDMSLENKDGVEIKNLNEAKPLKYKHQKYYIDPKLGELSKKIDFEFESELVPDKKLKVKGEIGIMEKGSRSLAGLVLYRNGRVIIGGLNCNYRPKKIFGDSGSFQFQRLYGELELINFPIDQTKSRFSWDGGIEEKFIDYMYDEFLSDINFIKKSKTIKLKNDNKFQDNVNNEEIRQTLQEKLNDSFYKSRVSNLVGSEYININKFVPSPKLIEIYKDEYKDSYYKFNLYYENNKTSDWLSIEKNKKEKDSFNIYLDWQNIFFSPFNNNTDAIIITISQFCIYMAIAEVKHNFCIRPYDFRTIINKLIDGKSIKKNKEGK
ncbi:MAG: ATP-binding protein [Metamycoplasmataceae bacterium]